MRILPLSVGEILEEVKHLENEQKEAKSELLKICWYMRGGVTLEEAYTMSWEERQLVGDIVKDNIETTKKSGMPFF
jgi:hypothetical protein